MSRRQRPPLLPSSRLALLERNRGSQHVPYARQSLQRRRTVALCPQSWNHRLGSVIKCALVLILQLSVARLDRVTVAEPLCITDDLTDFIRLQSLYCCRLLLWLTCRLLKLNMNPDALHVVAFERLKRKVKGYYTFWFGPVSGHGQL